MSPTKYRMKLRWGLVLLPLLLGNCEQYKPKPSEGFSAKAQTIVFERCVSCHAGGAAEFGFGIIDKPQLLIANGYLIPGDPEESLLYQKLLPNPPYGQQMPYGGPYLNPQQLADIREWISGLAKPEDEPPGETVAVTLQTTGLSSLPSAGNVVVKRGDSLVLSLSVRDGDSLAGNPATNIEGTCPKGSFSGSTYTSGIITQSCTLKVFADNPCTEILPGVNFSDVQALFSDPIGSGAQRCTGCHYLGNTDDLPAYGTTPGGAASRALILSGGVVQEGLPRASKLYLKITPEAKSRMPYRGTEFLSELQQAKVCNWILQGAE
jgi:hypothetical protein